MQVVQSVHGVFHHFDLARELESQGSLARIYSSFPWRRLAREGLPRERVRTFPWLQPPLLVLGNRLPIPALWSQSLLSRCLPVFDAWVARQIEECDAFVALSGAGLKTGAVVQSRGGRYICDRGSSHIRYQDRIMTEEYARWGVATRACDPYVVDREEAEYERADLITVASEFSRRTFVEMGVPAQKIRKVPYGVSPERFRKTGSPSADRFDILFAGAVSLRKGIPYLLEAFQRFRHPGKHLRLVGSLEPALASVLSRFDLSQVELTGIVTQPKLAEMMSRSHVLILPSVEDGFGLVLGQALACGCPLISSYHTGGEDMFTDGVEGFLVPPRSPEAILTRFEELAANEPLRERMSAAALDRVRSIGGWRDYGLAYAAVLQEATDQNARAALV